MRLRWTPTAADTLKTIYINLLEHHPSLANSTVIKLYDGVRSLKAFPHRGRGERKELENWYLLHCPTSRPTAEENTIEVLYIHHTSRERL